jgi:hypothetical protein
MTCVADYVRFVAAGRICHNFIQLPLKSLEETHMARITTPSARPISPMSHDPKASFGQGAPTRPRFCGAIAGVVAGGLGAAAYALTCRTDTIPFIAVCYSAAIALCAFIAAQLGPRLLRW